MDSVLYDAITEDNVNALEELELELELELERSVGNQLTPTNSTVLHIACQYGSKECVEHILAVHKALISKINARGETALHLAAKGGHLGVVKALIDSAKNLVRRPNNDLRITRATTVVQDLIRTPDEERETALHGAVRYNRKDVVELLVKEDPSYLHFQNKHDESALYLASVRYSTDIISTILENCNWPNIGDAGGRTILHAMFGGPDGRTALHAAVFDDGGIACVKLLLEKNKSLVKKADMHGWTAFHYAAYNNLDNIVELLVDADKSAGYLEDKKHGRIALHVAAYKGNLQVMKKLVQYYPDSWEIVDGSGRNILHIAVEENRKDVIGFILSRGFRASNNLLTKRDKRGYTPLHLITKFGCFVPELMHQESYFPEFMNRGARKSVVDWASTVDWEVLDNKKLTPLDILHSEQDSHTLADQVNVGIALAKAHAKKHWHLWRTLEEPDVESRSKRVVKHSEQINKEEIERYGKMINTHMIVAALIATVAFTAGFNLPDGISKNEQGDIIIQPYQGPESCFAVFIFSDAAALFLSVSSLLYNFLGTFVKDASKLERIVYYSAILNISSIVAMVASFVTGTIAILNGQIARSVTIAVAFISVCLILYVVVIFIRIFRGRPSKILLRSSNV